MQNVAPVKSDRRMLKSILTEQRKDADISQELIAEKLNLNQSTISSYESNAEKLKSQGVHFARVFFSAYEFPDHKIEGLMRKLFGDVMELLKPLEKTEVLTTSRIIPTFVLTTLENGRVNVVESPEATYIDEHWKGVYEAYIINQTEKHITKIIVKKSSGVSANDEVLLNHKEKGYPLATVAAVLDEEYILLNNGEAMKTPKSHVDIIGVVKRRQVDTK